MITVKIGLVQESPQSLNQQRIMKNDLQVRKAGGGIRFDECLMQEEIPSTEEAYSWVKLFCKSTMIR